MVRPNSTVHCRHFRSWPKAAAACEHLSRGEAPDDKREEWALLLAMPQLTFANHFYFSEFRVPQSEVPHANRESAQGHMHGLLGQRILSTPSIRALRASNRARSRKLARGIVEPLTQSMKFELEPSTHPIVDAVAGLTGIYRESARILSLQGGGAIEGSYRHYMVRTLHSHEFRYSRFNCTSMHSSMGRGH